MGSSVDLFQPGRLLESPTRLVAALLNKHNRNSGAAARCESDIRAHRMLRRLEFS
jgi:hypothetical protein